MPSTPESPRVDDDVVAREAVVGSSLPRSVRSSIHELGSGLDHSSIMGAEMIAGFLTWAGIGWLLDRWLGTGPWLLVIGALVGNAAGIYLIALRSRRMEGYDDAPRRFDVPPGPVPAAPVGVERPGGAATAHVSVADIDQGGRR